MKWFLLILLLSCSSIFSQIKRIDTIAVKNDTVKSSLAKLPRTVNLQPDKVLMLVKEEVRTDWAKYVIPIVGLLIGIFLNRFLNWVTSNKKVSRAGERWALEITLLEPQIKLQMTALAAFIKELKGDKWIHPTLGIINQSSGKSFTSLDNVELLHFIEKRYGYKWYYVFKSNKFMMEFDSKILQVNSQTHTFISFFESQHNLILSTHETFQKNTINLTNNFNSTVEELVKEMIVLSYLLKSSGIDIETDANFKLLFVFWKRQLLHMKSTEFNPLTFYNDYLKEFSLILECHSGDNRTVNVATIVNSLQNKIQAFEIERNTISVIFKIIIDRYENKLLSIRPMVDQLQNR